MVETEPVTLARRTFVSPSTEATEAFGAALARAIESEPLLARAGVALALDGELGSGKTAIARGVARGLGSVDSVHSPSFTLMHTYQGRLPIYHFDSWMEGRERAFLDGGGAEWLDGGGIALIEWAKRVEAWLPMPRLGLVLEHVGAHEPTRRILTLTALAARSQSALEPRVRALVALVRDFSPCDGENLSDPPGINETP